jgi:hypothetical protein
MTGDEGRLRLHRPVASGRVQVCVADARGVDADEGVEGGAELRLGHLFDFESLFEVFNDDGFHSLTSV